jgi:hypothetical protein
MLNISTTNVAVNLSDVLVDNGLRLVPKSNTLLNELNKALISVGQFSEATSKSSMPYSLVLASTGEEVVVRGNKSYHASTHDSFMDNYIDDMSGLVTNYISFARSVVNKEVNLLKEELQESLNNYRYKEPEDFFTVKYFKPHEVFTSYIVASEVSNYGDRKEFFEAMNLSPVSGVDFDLKSYLLTGDSEQDTLIVSWLESIGCDRAKGYIVDKVMEYDLALDQLLDYALVNYLFYRNLTGKNDLDLGYSATTMQTKSSGNRDYFGSKLRVVLELYRRDIANDRILTNNSQLNFSYFSDARLDITIYEENFEKFAEKGLSIDVLFGYISSGLAVTDITVDALAKKAEDYLNKWKNTRSLYLISLNNDRLNTFKQLLRERFEASLLRPDLSSDETEFLNTNQGFLDETKCLVNEYIDNLTNSDIDDLEQICLTIVAKIRYRFTNAWAILNEMAQMLKLSDEVTPMEAGLYACINLIVDYMLEQSELVKI